MIKKGFDLFTTSPSLYEGEEEKANCCEVCTSPFLNLCKPICKFRKATFKEFIDCELGKKEGAVNENV